MKSIKKKKVFLSSGVGKSALLDGPPPPPPRRRNNGASSSLVHTTVALPHNFFFGTVATAPLDTTK